MESSSKINKQGLWKEHAEAWKASGLTQRAYCLQEGISHRSFIYQRNRLQHALKKEPLSFIEVKPEPAVISNHTASLQLMLPNGIRLVIGNDVNCELLQTVLSIAGAISC